jgi:hypothetical protein
MMRIVILLYSPQYRIYTIHLGDRSYRIFSIIAPPYLWDFLMMIESIV